MFKRSLKSGISFITQNSHKRTVDVISRMKIHVTTLLQKTEDRKEMLASLPAVDEGTAGEKSVDIDTIIDKKGKFFPDATTAQQLFNGVPFCELPLCSIRVSRNNTIISVADYKGWVKYVESFMNTPNNKDETTFKSYIRPKIELLGHATARQFSHFSIESRTVHLKLSWTVISANLYIIQNITERFHAFPRYIVTTMDIFNLNLEAVFLLVTYSFAIATPQVFLLITTFLFCKPALQFLKLSFDRTAEMWNEFPGSVFPGDYNRQLLKYRTHKYVTSAV